MPESIQLDQYVTKRYHQWCGFCMMVGEMELRVAAERFACHIVSLDFKASEGWLNHFKLQHNLTRYKDYGKALDTTKESTKPFHLFKTLIEEENLRGLQC